VNKDAVKRPKGVLQWVPDGSQGVELRNYQSLFTIPSFDDPACKELPFEELCHKYLRKDSEKVYSMAKLDSSIVASEVKTGDCFQFERLGFFVVDADSTPKKLVFNRVLTLLEGGKGKKVGKSRKEQNMATWKAKEALKNIDPKLMFRKQTDIYSKFDNNGIPTHAADGKKLSKSLFKKLKKKQAKQKKLFESK